MFIVKWKVMTSFYSLPNNPVNIPLTTTLQPISFSILKDGTEVSPNLYTGLTPHMEFISDPTSNFCQLIVEFVNPSNPIQVLGRSTFFFYIF